MPQEIERKFLVRSDAFREVAHPVYYSQNYISPELANVRVRIAGEEAFLTIKSRRSGMTRSEFEYSIPIEDARQMLAECCPPCAVEKTRHTLMHAGHEWVVDEFHGANEGLIMAEIELEREDEPFSLPDWLGPEVTDDIRYYNSNLAKSPYTQW